MLFDELLVAGHLWIDGQGPAIDTAGDRLGFAEALLLQPVGDGERTAAVMAEDGDGLVFVELGEGLAGDFVHGHELCAFDVGGGVLPRFAYVQQEGRMFGGKLLFQLVYGDFEVHEGQNSGLRGEGDESRSVRQRLSVSRGIFEDDLADVGRIDRNPAVAGEKDLGTARLRPGDDASRRAEAFCSRAWKDRGGP